jgi:hypothetical protein
MLLFVCVRNWLTFARKLVRYTNKKRAKSIICILFVHAHTQNMSMQSEYYEQDEWHIYMYEHSSSLKIFPHRITSACIYGSKENLYFIKSRKNL